jgi:hypothetical protein
MERTGGNRFQSPTVKESVAGRMFAGFLHLPEEMRGCTMKIHVAAWIVGAWIVGLAATSAVAGQSLVRFDGGIGVNPVSAGPAANVVRGVSPGGQPWVIRELRAGVEVDGRLKANGRGLLLAGGNGIGTTGNQSVRAVLFCGNVAHGSALVPLEADGDFTIDDTLTPLPPNPCESPVLLIVNGADRWFAAGIPRD